MTTYNNSNNSIILTQSNPLVLTSDIRQKNIINGYNDLVETIDNALNLSFYTKNQFFRFLNNNSTNYFDRNNLAGHITSSAFVVNSEMTHMLLVHHRKLEKWLQTGGHWEDVADVPISLFGNAIKELQEEAYGDKEVAYEALHNKRAYHLDIHGVGNHQHFDVGYLLKIDPNIPVVVSHESLGVEWIALNYIKANAQKKEFSSARLHEVINHIERGQQPQLRKMGM